MTLPATQEPTHVARPLRVLASLIKADYASMNEAAENATKPYQIAIGEKLLEAKAQTQHGEFGPWVKRNFDFGERQAERYMAIVPATPSIENRRPASASLSQMLRDAGHEPRGHHGFSPQQKPINEIVNRAAETQKRLQAEALSRAEERDAERKLAVQLIDIGYKTLAAKLHPDKGGSRDAMSRLNRVRARLKQHA